MVTLTGRRAPMPSGRTATAALALGLSLALAGVGAARAQQVTGTPGSPSATTTIDGQSLPAAPPPFGGVINLDAEHSKPWWPPTVVPPKGAPNVLLIMTDDAGYGVSGTFGGVIPTPTLDRIAADGPALHPVPLHRALLADARGADHRPQPPLGRLRRDRRAVHRLSRLRLDHRPRTTPRSATILKENGYATSWFGKDHNTPELPVQPAGPFDQWPVGHGLRLFLRLHGRRDRPVDAVPVPQHDARSSRGSASPATT